MLFTRSVGNWAYRPTEVPRSRIDRDLYKWCAKIVPLLDSDIVMDALELAHAARCSRRTITAASGDDAAGG